MRASSSVIWFLFAAVTSSVAARDNFPLSRYPPGGSTRCIQDVQPIRSKPAKEHIIEDITITLSGPLVQCEEVVVSWDDKRIPEGHPYRFTVYAGVNWIEPDGNENSSGENSTTGWGVHFATPARSHKWLVDFPAGSNAGFSMDVWSPSFIFHGSSKASIIQPSNSSKCIPAAHYPVTVKVPQDLTQCGVSRISWTGGSAPYSIWLYSIDIGIVEELEVPIQQGEDGNWFVDWLVDYPYGQSIGIEVWSEATDFVTAHTVTVQNPGTTGSCISRYHLEDPRRWFSRPLAIAGFVLGGLTVLAGVSFGGWKGYQWYKNKEGAIQLQ